MTQLSVYLDDELLALIRNEAELTGFNPSAIIRERMKESYLSAPDITALRGGRGRNGAWSQVVESEVVRTLFIEGIIAQKARTRRLMGEIEDSDLAERKELTELMGAMKSVFKDAGYDGI